MTTWSTTAARQSSPKITMAECTLARTAVGGGVETTTLRLATRALRPDLTAHFYDPRLGSAPSLSRSIQAVQCGRTQAGYGEMTIYAHGGGIDAYLANWFWSGQPVVIKHGFEGQAATAFEPLFSGRMGVPTRRGEIATVPLEDLQGLLWETDLPASPAAYTGQLPSVVAALLAVAGVTTIDATAWATWAAANDYPVHLAVGEAEDVGQALDRLLAPLGCWYGFDRAGALRIGTLGLPSTAPAALALDQWELLERPTVSAWDDLYWRVEVEWLSATDPATYATVWRDDGAVKGTDPRATVGSRQTCLTSETAAALVRDRLWGIFSTRRQTVTVAIKTRAGIILPGDEVYLNSPRDGLTGQFVCMAVDLDTTARRVALELMR